MIEVARLAVFHAGERWELELADGGAHALGGTSAAGWRGLTFGTRPLPRIARLSAELPLVQACASAGMLGPDGLELHYGLAYSGCRLSWSCAAAERTLLELEPRESESDWPYPGAPDALPEVPCAVVDRSRWSAARVGEEFLEGEALGAGEGLVVVPPLRPGGVPLWDPEGEAEGVQILFRVRPDAGRIEAWNRCS